LTLDEIYIFAGWSEFDGSFDYVFVSWMTKNHQCSCGNSTYRYIKKL